MSKIFVTGASGFIAKHIVKELLDAGHQVVASVRSQNRVHELDALFPDALSYVFLDLLDDAGWDTAMIGCDALIHTASPFPLENPADPNVLIKPAVEGTKRALKGAKAAGITRVVLTSSIVAIYKDKAKPKSAPSTEANWTSVELPAVTAYEASKTLAEQAAWDFVKENPSIALTSINPGLVAGPALDTRFGTSLDLIARIMKGTDPLAPPMEIGIVDVRDVARLHVQALTLDATKGERFAAVAGTKSFRDIGRILKTWDDTLTPADKVAPTLLLKALAIFMPELKTVVKGLGYNMHVSATKAENTFDMTFKSPEEAIVAAGQSIKEAGKAQ